MGQFVNSTATSVMSWAIAAFVVLINMFALCLLITSNWLSISGWAVAALLAATGLYLGFISYLLLHGWLTATGRRQVVVAREGGDGDGEADAGGGGGGLDLDLVPELPPPGGPKLLELEAPLLEPSFAGGVPERGSRGGGVGVAKSTSRIVAQA